jgi:hypothetical protein
MNQQLIYTLKINCNGCNFNLMVNDRSLLKLDRGSNINTEIPCNTYLNNGLNEFICNITPTQGQENLSETSFVKIMIMEVDESNANSSKEISSFDTPSFKPEEGKQPYTQFDLVGKFSVTINFISLCNTGVQFVHSDYLHNELFIAYMELWQAFKSRNIDKVMRLLSLKIKESAGLKGSSVDEMEKEMRADYLNYMNDSSLQLWEFTPEIVFLKIYGYNKLACLEVKNGNQPICFINRADHLAIYIPVYFFRNPVNQVLEIIR